MTHNKRAWWVAAIVAGLLVLVALACSNDGTPEVRQSRGIGQPRGDPMTVTVTPVATATLAPRATMWSPMETAHPEKWTDENLGGGAGGSAISTVVSGRTGQAWMQSCTGACANRLRYAVSDTYLPNGTPNASFHLNFDIKIISTPSAGGVVIGRGASDAAAVAPYIRAYPRSSSTPNAYAVETLGGKFVFDMTDNEWHNIDLYADQQADSWTVATPGAAGETLFALSIDGTPVATPATPAFTKRVSSNGLRSWSSGDNSQPGSFSWHVDNYLIEFCKDTVLGTCVTPTPQPQYVEVTATNSPTPDFTSTFTPTHTPTPPPTWTPLPSATPADTMTPGPTPTARPTISGQTNAGIYVYSIETSNSYFGDCAALVAAGAPETWSTTAPAEYETAGIGVADLIICNTGNTPKQCTLSAEWLTTGYTEVFVGGAGCYPSSNSCDAPSNRRELFGGEETHPCGGGTSGSQHSGTYSSDWWVLPYRPSANRLEISAVGAGLSSGSCSSAGSYVSVAVDCGPSPTPRPSRTPSPTPSPTVTRTPGPTRPTATHTVSPTPWGGITCPTAVVTVDANLADWTAIPATPMPLSAADASYIWPAATPSVADLSGLFKCAHDSTTLFLSGVITDSVLYQDSAPIDDDAAQIAVDGWGDGFLRYRADDHELTITQDGRLRDLATLPITATVATTLTVAGWQFEIGIPRAVIELPTLTQRLIGLVFGLIDDDDGGQLDQQMIAPTRTVLLQ